MRIKILYLFIFLTAVFGICFADRQPTKEEKFEKHLILESPSGIKARFFEFSEKGQGKTFLEKDEIIITTLNHVQPISWHPTRDILLVKEYSSGKDNRCYLLDIGAEEYSKKGDRDGYILGDRYVNRARWSEDGTKVTLYSTFNEEEYTYDLAKYVNMEQPEVKKYKEKESDKNETGEK